MGCAKVHYIPLLGQFVRPLEQMFAHPARVKPIPGKELHRIKIDHAGSIQNGLD